MQSKKFDKDDGLYDLINVNDDFEGNIITSRTDNLIFNSSPVDWYRNILTKEDLTKYSQNGNNSSADLLANKNVNFDTQSALDKNSVHSLFCVKDTQFSNNISNNFTSDLQIYNNVYQNIEKCKPHSIQSKLQLTNDINHSNISNFILCPECKKPNASNLDWCLSCGYFIIKLKKPNSFKTITSNNSVSNNYSPSLIKETGNYSQFIDNSKDFDRMYKRTCEISNCSIKNNEEINLKSVNASNIDSGLDEISKQGSVSDMKLNLSELELSVRENKIKLSQFDLDIDIVDTKINKMITGNISLSSPKVPPLDFSNLDSNRSVRIIDNNENNHLENSKENNYRSNKKWVSSQVCQEMPKKIFKKIPSKYYRNKFNFHSNQIGLNVFPAKIKNDLTMVCDKGSSDISNNQSKSMALELLPDNDLHLSFSNDENQNVEKLNHSIDLICETHSNDLSMQENKNNSNVSDTALPLDVHSDWASNWQCLPAEIWIKIMMYLPYFDLSRLQQTCRRFYSIGLDSQLWSCVTLFRHNKLTDGHIINIAHKMPKELHFKNCLGTSITFNGLKQMFNICGHGVEKLSFISCSRGALEGDQFLVLSAAFCPNVTHINASYLMNLQDSTLISMTEGFNKIVSLNIMGAHAISNEAIKSLIKNHRSSLTSLDLYGCFKLNSATLRILEECLNLKSLALGSIKKLKRASMVDLLKKLSQLTNLDLRGTMNLIDDSLLGQICVLCPNLQQIILSNSCLVGNHGLKSLANSNVSKTLKVLDLCGCSRITDNGIEAILKHCQSLEDLDISCTGITGRITKLFLLHPPPSLKCLRINNNKLISESELASIVNSTKKLTTVYMCGLTSIDTWQLLESRYSHILFKHE